jgi:hypothetical protein
MYAGLWGVAALLLLAGLGLLGMMLALFRLCEILTDAAHRLFDHATN